MDPRTIRIFLSSTFRDFGEERDLLVKKVFPALRARLKDRFVELVDIDLRWGITAEEAERGDVLPICLTEIDRSRPYFIGMLGERYGWIPTSGGYAPELLDAQPWLRAHQGGKSVTELEILYGVLNNRRMRGKAFFYFRSPGYAKTKGADFLSSSKEDLKRQQDLKRRIRQSGCSVSTYPNPDHLAKKLEKDLWRMLNSHFPASSVPDSFERDCMRHEAYALPRRRLYVGADAYQEALRKKLSVGQQRILVKGDSGSGKSALLANFFYQYKKEYPKYLIHQHYLSASADAADPHVLVKRLIEFVKRQISSDTEVETDPQKLMDSLPQWLAAASSFAKKSRTRFVFVIDALNKLTEQNDLRWWPTFLPVGIYFVVSCLPGEVLDALNGQKRLTDEQDRSDLWVSIRVKPLTKSLCAELVNAYLARFNKKLAREMVKQVQAHALSSNPLFIRTLAEELRLFGVHEELQKRLSYYLESLTVDDLYERVLQRVESDCGRTGVQRAMTAVWASRSGLSEKEIVGIAGLTPASWATIRNALDEVLLESNGRQIFAHDYVRMAVKDRYVPDEKKQNQAHQKISSWFAQQPMDRRRAEEEPWQLLSAKKWAALKKCLIQAEMFKHVETLDGFRGLSRYWTALEDNLSLNLGLTLMRANKVWIKDEGTQHKHTLQTSLVDFFVYCSRYEYAEKIACVTLVRIEEQYGVQHVESIKVRNQLANIYTLQSRYKKSIAAYETVLSLCSIGSTKKKAFQEQYADALSGSAENFYYLGDYDKALPRFELVFKARTEQLGPTHEKTLQTANNIANVYLECGDYVKASELHRKNLIQARRILGKEHPTLGLYLANYASTLEKNGENLEAIDAYKTSIAIYEKSLGTRAFDLTLPLGNLGLLFQRTGFIEDARMLLQKCVDLIRLTIGSRHRETVRGLVNLATVTEDIDQRKVLLEEACTVAADVLGDHPFTAAALGSYAWVLVEDNDLSRAHKKLIESHQMLTRFLPRNHYQVIESMYALAQLNYYNLDDDEQALIHLNECLKLQISQNGIACEKLPEVCLMMSWIFCSRQKFPKAAETLTYAIQYVEKFNKSLRASEILLFRELAQVRRKMGKNAEAISMYKKCISALLKSDPWDLEELYETFFELGALYELINDQASACLAYENSLQHAVKFFGDRDAVLINIMVSLAAVREADGDLQGAIDAREKVESLMQDLGSLNQDIQEQRDVNKDGLIRLYGHVN
jgi:nephrocystin-3